MGASVSARRLQSLAVDDFFYFYLRLRKSRIRAVVSDLQTQHPDESPEQLAHRLIESFQALSFVGGSLLDLPMLLPGVGTFLQAAGFVAGASALTRMHLYLILEIALLYGRDIDDEARVPEMMAVVAATGAAATTPILVRALEISPVLSIPISGLAASATARLIGEAAIRHYQQQPLAVEDAAEPAYA